MSSHADTIRTALYAAVQPPNVKLAPVPGTPIGDAHLALDALLDENQQLREALERVVETETAIRPPHPASIARVALAGDGE